MTTNGIALKRKLPDLVKNGLDSLNISLDTLDKFKFELLTRRRGTLLWCVYCLAVVFIMQYLGWENVIEAIETAIRLQIPSVKLNAVVMKNVNDMEVVSFVDMTKDWPVYIRFIEYMPFDGKRCTSIHVTTEFALNKDMAGNKWNKDKMVPYKEMLATINSKYPNVYKVSDERNDTSKACHADTCLS